MFSRAARIALLLAPVIVFARSVYPPAYRGVQTHVDGVFVTPVPNAPFSAVVTLESSQVLQDGTPRTLKSSADIARDSLGRIYNEQRALLSASFAGVPPVISVHIYDPQTRLNIFLNPANHIARQSTLHGPAAFSTQPVWLQIPPNSPNAIKTDLGSDFMENLRVQSTRIERKIPAENITVVDEYWYSPDLSMNILTKRTDPRTGTQTVRLTQVNRAEPAPSRFQVPDGYKIVDVNPPAAAR